ncbi:MAG: uroporphyrinogen-III C-methyltransferase [Nevskia sp.]|nr:uroporphyrinogen-III C-methyltransferase [Nevskia sp.]
MTETEASPSRRSSWGLLLLALLLLGGAGTAGWHLWHASHDTEESVAAQEALLIRLNRQLGDAQSSIEQLHERQSDLLDALHHNADDVAKLQNRADESEQVVAHLSADVKGGRTRAQLLAVEQVLLMANDRVQLAHDARGAGVALQLAEERLSALAEPRLFEVRKAVAQERAALLAVPLADRASAALNLSGLIARADSLPLRQHPVAQVAETAATTPVPQTSFVQGWGGRGWASLRELFAHVFIVQRTDKPVDRLLPPEQENLVRQLLALKLESARAALLMGDTASFRGALESALQWLADYYRPEDPTVSAARAELERLHGLELDPPLPDLSRSLGLLRAYLDAMPR